MSKKDSKKTLPSVEDKRDKNNKSNSIMISNYATLDANNPKDKAKIEQLVKEKQKDLESPFYSIDLNTNNVKQNNRVSFIAYANKPKNFKPKDDNKEVYDLVYQDYIKMMQQFNKALDEFVGKTYDNVKDLDKDIYRFNTFYDTTYYYGFNMKVRNFLDDDFKQDYLNKYADAVASTQFIEIRDVCSNIIEFVNEDIDNTKIKRIISDDDLKDLQQQIKDKYCDTSDKDSVKEFVDDFNKDDIEIFVFELIKGYVYKDVLKWVDAEIENNKDYYKKVKTLYKTINKRILEIVDNFNEYGKKLKDNTPNNYDIVKFKTNNNVITKIDPIAKTILSGNTYEIGKLIKADNNYNDKSMGAVFSIKTADLSNIDFIQELQQKGIQITHFGKKIIDDIDILLDENKGNVNNNDRLVALTPKMIAKKVYNTKQPTKKQQQEIESELRQYSNIYLFFIQDDTTAFNVEKLVQLKDKGLEFLQDKEGNVLNIGDALDDNLILNAKYGYSAKYQSFVYVFDNKSIFERVNQLINNDVGKQLKLSLKDKSDEIFNDYNKNVNKEIVGIRYYLFERVNQIKHSIESNQKTNKEVLLSNIYDEYKITTPKQKAVIRKAIKNILDYWVDINYIISYEFLDKEGNKIPKNSTKEIHKIYLNVNAIKSETID